MKKLLWVACPCFVLALSISCQQAENKDKQARIDSLVDLVNQLKPGLGEFMIQMEYHHGKLASSLAEKNYEKAAFEVGEMQELAQKIEGLRITNDKLKEPFPVLFDKYLRTPLEFLVTAAAKKDDLALKANYEALTNNCNGCHRENNMSFMRIN
jgi:hypothetical protein